jgi:hypothetical protein
MIVRTRLTFALLLIAGCTSALAQDAENGADVFKCPSSGFSGQLKV